MSRIGKLPIAVPAGVEVTLDGQNVEVTGPKGTLSHVVARPITVSKNDEGQIVVARPDDERESRSLHGLTRTLVANMVTGVTAGYEKKLEIVGVGYRVLSKGPQQLEFSLGFSHPVVVERPRGHHLRRREQHAVQRARNLEAAGGRGRSQHPQDPQARALQGQGCAVRGRAGAPQGRKGW